MRVLGIMSGTSLDGVDYVVCRISTASIKLVRHWQVAFPKRLRERLLAAASNRCAAYEVGQLHHDLGRFYALGATRAGTTAVRGVQLVGLHGQTIFHHPHPRHPATLQLGEPAYLADTLRIPVVNNFRASDLAAGGQGAPLATLFHRFVFAVPGQHVCVNNLGGISNVTSLDARRRKHDPRILAFDTGPANMLMDLAMRTLTQGKKSFDRHGRLAAQGQPVEALVESWLRHPFFRQPPPKSTGRELFGEPFFQTAWQELRRHLPLLPPEAPNPERVKSLPRHAADALATFTEFTARSLALNYRLHLPDPPDRVILCGGGAANPCLVKRITACLENKQGRPQVIRCDDLGWPTQTIEAAAFALLAWFRWHRLPANLPETTGANRAVLLGQNTEG